MQVVETAPHEFTANYLFDGHGLQPFFAADSAVKTGGGTRRGYFEIDGENWTATLYYQDSGIVHPGATTPAGTPFKLDEIREFRVAVRRAERQDPVGEQDFNAHLAPRWQGMEAETKYNDTKEITVPEGIEEGVNVKVSGSNIEFDRYPELLRRAFQSVDVAPRYFDQPHPYSNIQDAERYVRIDRDRSGPIHARDGPIAQMGHLLENDREGYRKVVQNDDDLNGENLPGYYHTVTLGTRRMTEAFPSHELPKEIKHYYAREALSKSKDEPLAHPKLGASYQVSRWDGKLGVTPEEIEQLNQELNQAVYSVLADAGLQIHQGGNGPYVEDAYFDAQDVDRDDDPVISLDLTQIEQRQESVVIKHLADGLSPVEWDALDVLVTDGGRVSPNDIAEKKDRHPDSVRRALRRIQELVDRKYGEVALSSPHVAELVHSAVQQANDAVKGAVETAAKAMEAAERGIDGGTSALIAWASNHGIDLRDDSEGYVQIELGQIEGETLADVQKRIRELLRQGRRVWREAGRDPSKYVGGEWSATAHYELTRKRSYLNGGTGDTYRRKDTWESLGGFVGATTG